MAKPKSVYTCTDQDPIYIDYDRCTGCSRCMEVCPLQKSDHPPLTRSPAFCPSRSLELEKRRLSPCREACSLGVNVQADLVLTAAGRYDEALEAFKKAGDEASAYNNLGCIYLAQNKYREAAGAFQKAVELNPKYYEKARENMKYAEASMKREEASAQQ